jgi:hypothetical protein
MAGPIVLVALMVLVFPPVLFGGGMVVAALLGQVFSDFVDETHPDSPWIELNR